jgi:hypothetical protein
MRASSTSDGLKVNVIAGTYVVLLAFDLPPDKCKGLMGFSIHRIDHTENESYYLSGMKAFDDTHPGLPAGSQFSTKDHPIQSFQWADYSAKPGHVYTYTVTALKGSPGKLTPIAEVKIKITTESPESGNQDVYFNRGTAASQEYVRRFGDKSPEEVPNNQAFIWLSRGLYEALTNFVTSCKPGKHALRVAAYEFNYEPFLKILKATLKKGVDIKIVYDARKDPPKNDNDTCVGETGLAKQCQRRTKNPSYISHNKFIVKLENDKPVAVAMGSTNFSIGGIFGHSNVVHIIEEPAIAEKYFQYWKVLNENPEEEDAKNSAEEISPLPEFPLQKDESCVFSPRHSLDALELYAKLAMSATDGLFMTFAFGMNKLFKDVYKNS